MHVKRHIKLQEKQKQVRVRHDTQVKMIEFTESHINQIFEKFVFDCDIQSQKDMVMALIRSWIAMRKSQKLKSQF